MGKLKKKKSKTAKPPVFGEVLTLADAAAYLRVSEDGLKADADAGRLPGGVVAGEWRFSRQALADWLCRLPPGPIQWPIWPDPAARDREYESYEASRGGQQEVA